MLNLYFFWSVLKDLKQTLMDQVWDHSENFLALTNKADYFQENGPYISTEDLININWSKK